MHSHFLSSIIVPGKAPIRIEFNTLISLTFNAPLQIGMVNPRKPLKNKQSRLLVGEFHR